MTRFTWATYHELTGKLGSYSGFLVSHIKSFEGGFRRNLKTTFLREKQLMKAENLSRCQEDEEDGYGAKGKVHAKWPHQEGGGGGSM